MLPGDAVITMDSDLQHDPKYIDTFVEEWKAGNKIVEGVRSKRDQGNIIHKLIVKCYYKILKRFTKIDLNNKLDYKILDRQVVNDILKIGEKEAFYKGLVEYVGYPKKQIVVDIQDRNGNDTSKFTFKALSRIALNAITSYSTNLLNVSVWLGVLFGIISIAYFVYNIVLVCTGNAFEIDNLVAFILMLMGSLLFICMGVLGLYLGKVLQEVKDRPRFIISEKV